MPVDLDEMFTAFGRHADAVPLAPAAQARRRGQQRTRHLVAAAAAVFLIVAGVSAVVRHDRQSAPVTSKRGLPAVGAPIEFGDQARAATVAGEDGRLYTAWQTLNGQISLNAVDLRTGAVVWPARTVAARTDTLSSLRTLPEGLLLTVDHADVAEKGSLVQIHEPADGRLRWQLPFAGGDALIPHRSGLVWMSAQTGRTVAFDWVTGAKRWELPAPADRPVQTLGTLTDGNWASSLGRSVAFTDDHLVQVTRAGKVQLRDITTGDLLRTVTGAAPDPDPRTFIAYDDRLYNDEHECCGNDGYQIRRTDLSTAKGSSTVVLSAGADHELGQLLPCGDQRLCVIDWDRDRRTTLTALDAPSGRRLWQVSTAVQDGFAAAVNGFTMVGGPTGDRVIYDRAGRQVFSTPDGSMQWLTADTLLLLPDYQVAGPARTVSLPDGRITQLGEMPPRSDACAWTPERLACPTLTSVRIWSLSG